MKRAVFGLTACLALVACDEVVDVRNRPPSAEAVGLCSEGDRLFVLVRLVDLEMDPADLELVAMLPDGAARIPTGAAGDGLTGLSTERTAEGRLHRVEWAAPCGPDDAPCTAPCDRLGASLSGVQACALRPTTPPASLTVRALARDTSTGAATETALSVTSPCAE
ncbi:MAG: hypothetical protein KC583_01735 [Myxococcales bacterium]|nr:hypothetical protein [Myxococcales bacterium]